MPTSSRVVPLENRDPFGARTTARTSRPFARSAPSWWRPWEPSECTACVCVRAADDNYAQIPLAFTVLDSPATTSAITYKVQATRGADTQTVYLNGNQGGDAYSGNTASTITVMEVSA